MPRISSPALALGLVLLSAGVAGADWFERAAASFRRDYHRNKAWPEPFVWPDRDAAVAPFAVMVHNGWRLQNTISEYHFEPGTARLTEAGQLKIHWILTEAPPQHRTIFVERGSTLAETSDRVKAVELAAGAVGSEGPGVQVFETLPARATSADYLNAVNRRYRDTTPEPRLPSPQAAGKR